MFILTVLAAVGILCTMISGSVVTYAFANGFIPSPDGVFSVLGHRFISEGAGTLVIVLALWTTFGATPAKVKIMSWVAVALVAVEAFIGHVGAPLSHGLGFLHAFCAQLTMVVLAHVIIYTWPGWKKAAAPVPAGRPSFTMLANLTVAALLLQVALGAAYRHDLLSVVWHILGAFLAVIFVLGMVVLVTQVPANEPLKLPAIWLASLLGVQVTLGMILISLSQPPEHLVFASIVVATHVAVGTSALATSVMNSMLVRKCVKAAS
jgi:heme A synthase